MADDYGKIKKTLMKVYRAIRFRCQYFGETIPNGERSNHILYEWILSQKPGMVGRIGAVESRCIYSLMKGKEPTEKNKRDLNICAGVFPINETKIEEFFRIYTEALKKVDFFVAWSVQGGGAIYRKFCPNAYKIDFYALEPFFYKQPWTKALKGRKVLIVHPFAESIQKQYCLREKLFDNVDVLPEFKSLTIIKAVQSNAGCITNYTSWKEALDFMIYQIEQADFDIAIIGAGSYGLPLAAYVKQIGKQAVHMAGVTQILFGIKGKRWENDSLYQRFFNEHWVHPTESETPEQSGLVEGGTYW